MGGRLAPAALLLLVAPAVGDPLAFHRTGEGPAQMPVLRDWVLDLQFTDPSRPAFGAVLIHPGPGTYDLANDTMLMRVVPYSSSLALAALGAMAAALLYNRILGQRSLEHEKRVRLLELAKAHPGVLIGQAAKRLQVSYHCADHHASVLARCGQVDIVRAGRMRAIYPSGSIPVAHRAALVWLRRGPQAEALRLVLQHPGRRSSELASLMGCKKSSAFEKLRNLRKHGLVRVDALAGYHITEQGCQTLGLLERLPALQVPPAPRAEAPTGPSEAT